MSNPTQSGTHPKFTPPSLARVDAHLVFNDEVGRTLRRLRLARTLTQARLAELAELSTNYVARLERGELGPSLSVATRLSVALGVGPSELVATYRARIDGVA